MNDEQVTRLLGGVTEPFTSDTLRLRRYSMTCAMYVSKGLPSITKIIARGSAQSK
jgi:hypothetical protein